MLSFEKMSAEPLFRTQSNSFYQTGCPVRVQWKFPSIEVTQERINQTIDRSIDGRCAVFYSNSLWAVKTRPVADKLRFVRPSKGRESMPFVQADLEKN